MSGSGMDGGSKSADQPGHSAGGDSSAAADRSRAFGGGEASESRSSAGDHAADSDRRPHDKGGAVADDPGGDQVEFASSRGLDAPPHKDSSEAEIEFASSRASDAARQDAGDTDARRKTGDGHAADAPQERDDDSVASDAATKDARVDGSKLEIPGVEDPYYRDIGQLANRDFPEEKWQKATPEVRRKMVETFHGDLSARRLEGTDLNAPELEIRELRYTETEGYQVDGPRRVVLDEALLSDDDPSAVIGAVAKAHQYDYQEQRIAGKFGENEIAEQTLEDRDWKNATPDWEYDVRHGVFDPGAWQENVRVVDARAAEANGRREFWHQRWQDQSAAGQTGVDHAGDRPSGERSTVDRENPSSDLPGDHMAGVRSAGDALEQRFPPDEWKNHPEERSRIVMEAHGVVREQYGLDTDTRGLRLEDLGENEMGYFDPKDNTVHMNTHLLESDSPDRAFGNLLHENRHASQWKDLQTNGTGSEYYVAHKEYPHAKDAKNPTPEEMVDYSYTPLETDARCAGAVGMETFWRAAAHRSDGERL